MRGIEKALEKRSRSVALTPLEIKTSLFKPEKTSVEKSYVSSNKPQIQLDFKELAKSGLLTADSMRGSIAEQYRHLKRPLLNIASGDTIDSRERANLIAITSALRGEGKTFTAFNLAMSIAMEQDVSVLLVDGDLIARSLSRILGLQDSLGLSDLLLEGRRDLRDVITGTNVPHLNVLSAGSVNGNTTELLASKQMRGLVAELSERYSNRIVLIDTAPVLLTSQAMIMDALVGQILFVVEEGETPLYAIQDALSQFSTDKSIGLVLNKCHRLVSGNYFTFYDSY